MEKTGKFPGIDLVEIVVHSETRDPHKGRNPNPSVKIKEYYLHLRVKSGGREEYFTLDRNIIDLYLTKTFDPVFSAEYSGEEGSDEAPTLRLRQRVSSHELTPSDKLYAIKTTCVIMDVVMRLVAEMGEQDLTKYRLRVFDNSHMEDMEVSQDAFESATEAARLIGFEPTRHIPEQILDLAPARDRQTFKY
ncbi:hypothetical protein KY359_05300 [Candidatus Woesearchaeota archaeon]|nr:hypothetical protein [Candidatus Woesearchaeota archaeon]